MAKAKLQLDRGPDHVSDEALRSLLGYEMKRAFNVVHHDLRSTLDPFGLRMLTFTALVLIVDNPGLRQSQLAAAMDMERPNLVVILDELEARALIVRDRDPTDRRAYALKPTRAGGRLCARAFEAVKAHERRLLADVDDESRAVVSAAFRKIQSREAKD